MNIRRIILYILILALLGLAVSVYYVHTYQPLDGEIDVTVYSNLFFGLLVVTLGYLGYHISLVQKDQKELREMFNKYIRTHLKKGDSQKSIKKSLKKAGWEEEEVKERIDKVKKHIKR